MENCISFPIRLESELLEIRLSDDVVIRKLDDETRSRVLGIRKATFNDDGKIKSYVVDGPDPLTDFMGPEVDCYDQLYSSNYVASVPTHSDAEHLNYALKLAQPSCTALYIGHSEPRSRHFLSPPCYYGKKPLVLLDSDTKNLGDLFRLKRSSKDKKLAVMAEMFLYALSVAPRPESRFIELSVVLEMLLLPTSSTELSYRFALRMAKVLAKHYGAGAAESFKAGQQIYRTRSRLVHSGIDKDLETVSPVLEVVVRQLLVTYLQSPEAFSEEALDALCIAG